MPDTPDELLTLPQAAARIGVDRTRVWRLVRDGRIPAQRVGPHWLVYASDADRYAAERRKAGRPPWRKPRVPDET